MFVLFSCTPCVHIIINSSVFQQHRTLTPAYGYGIIIGRTHPAELEKRELNGIATESYRIMYIRFYFIPYDYSEAVVFYTEWVFMMKLSRPSSGRPNVTTICQRHERDVLSLQLLVSIAIYITAQYYGHNAKRGYCDSRYENFRFVFFKVSHGQYPEVLIDTNRRTIKCSVLFFPLPSPFVVKKKKIQRSTFTVLVYETTVVLPEQCPREQRVD